MHIRYVCQECCKELEMSSVVEFDNELVFQVKKCSCIPDLGFGGYLLDT